MIFVVFFLGKAVALTGKNGRRTLKIGGRGFFLGKVVALTGKNGRRTLKIGGRGRVRQVVALNRCNI